jgi:predicted MFS family arabinose efflux permease
MPSPATRLALAHGGAHGADQAVLAALPLAGALLGLPPAVLGLLAAAHGLAWMAMSLPAGRIADTMPRRRAVSLGLGTATAGFALAAAAIDAGPAFLALAVLLGAAGLALHAVAAFSYLPHGAPSTDALVAGNARMGLTRALATAAAPPAAAAAIALGAPAPFALAALLAALSLALARSLPPDPAPPARPSGPLWEGLAMAWRQPIFRAVLLVSAAWTAGLFALLAALVPLALERGLSPEAMTAAVGLHGAGLALGALLAPWLARRLSPWLLMVGAPALGLPAALLLWAAPGPAAVGLGLLGVAALVWQTMQSAIRQTLAPPETLGRLTGSFQLASFGIRSLGSLAGAAGVALGGADGDLAAAALLALLSVGIFLLSLLARLRALPTLPGPATAAPAPS